MDNLDPLLQPQSETFSLRGKEYQANLFTVAQEEEVYEALDVIAEVCARVADGATSAYIVVRYALREACILIKHGTSLTVEEILALDRDAFVLVLAKVIEVNEHFFVRAAQENPNLFAATRKD